MINNKFGDETIQAIEITNKKNKKIRYNCETQQFERICVDSNRSIIW